MPSQLPAQALPSLAHALRPPTGAPLTATHVPTLPARLQLAHCPVHAALQQTPSAQKVELHWLPAVQAAPDPPRATQTCELLQ